MTKEEYGNIKAKEFDLLASMGALDDVLAQLKVSFTTEGVVLFKIDDGIVLECVNTTSYIIVDNEKIITLESDTQKYIYNYINPPFA